jgi:hypothetical protein
MKAFIGVTDNDWFAFLAGLSGIDEVNFRWPICKLMQTKIRSIFAFFCVNKKCSILCRQVARRL